MKNAIGTIVRNHLWIGAIMLGVFFIGLGAFFIYEGFAAKHTVQQALIAEQAVTASDAAIPNAPIVNLATAEAQEDIITAHTLGTLGPYSDLERGSPERATYLDGLTIRNSLNMAVLGLRVSDLVLGVGAVIMVIGAASLLLLAPLLFWVREPAAQRADEPAPQRRPAVAHAPGAAA